MRIALQRVVVGRVRYRRVEATRQLSKPANETAETALVV